MLYLHFSPSYFYNIIDNRNIELKKENKNPVRKNIKIIMKNTPKEMTKKRKNF